MKRYGLRVGDVGLEFQSREDREKAILTFTRGSTMRVNDSSGVVYAEDGKTGSFSTYEREHGEIATRCYDCKGVFSHDTCNKRSAPKTDYYDKVELDNETPRKAKSESAFLCDGCLAIRKQKAEEAEATAVLERSSSAV